jgi:hypothetical protein
MQWSDVTKAPPRKVLRQFAGLFLVIFLGLAGWRWFQGRAGVWTQALAAVSVLVGVTGLIVPSMVRPIYTGWMIAAFPIGWTVSRLAIGTIFFAILTPLAALFRLSGRDALRLRPQARASLWTPKEQPRGAGDYFRQF